MKKIWWLWLLAAAPLLFAAEEMTVTGSRVNIRRSPSTKGAVIGSVKAGDRVMVKEIKQGWAVLDGRPGYVSATFLRKEGAAPAPRKTAPAKKPEAAAAPAKKLPPGQVFPDLPVVAGSKRDVTVRGMLFPMAKGRLKYALLRVVNGKYVVQCYIYVPVRNEKQYREFANKEVQLVGYWYKVDGWSKPVMQVRRIRGL